MTTLQASAQAQLRQLVEKIEYIEQEIADKKADHKEIYKEAKGAGFDTKIIRKIVARRKRSKQEVQEEDSILTVYLHALEGTPMGDFIDRQQREEAHA